MRDDLTLQRLCGPINSRNRLLREVFVDLSDDSSVIINLGPDRASSGGIWFSYVMALLELVAPMICMFKEGEVSFTETYNTLQSALLSYNKVIMVGAPFLVADFIEFLSVEDLSIFGDDRLFVFTGGGWKGRKSSSISADEFRQSVVSRLHLKGLSQVRDAFNQVELNTIFIECEYHRKHIPPWVYAFVRDPETLQPMKLGSSGLLSYSDASSRSFPCFIISDDFGIIDSCTCECGITSPFVVHERRLESKSDYGCAQEIAKLSLV